MLGVHRGRASQRLSAPLLSPHCSRQVDKPPLACWRAITNTPSPIHRYRRASLSLGTRYTSATAVSPIFARYSSTSTPLTSNSETMAPTVAKLVSESEPYQCPGKLRIKELWLEVPLDHSQPSLGTIKLFATRTTKFEKPIDGTTPDYRRPLLVFLQGGPGFGNPHPRDSPLAKYMLERGYELLLLDYRGTGVSTPVSADALRRVGGPQEQADYLKLFRADSIVKDLEAVRLCLTKDYPDRLKKWTIFGQSFGGMTSMTYLSFAPEGLEESYVCGGLPALDKGPEDVYGHTFHRLIERNEAFYEKFPGDVQATKRIVDSIRKLGGSEGIRMPRGGFLTGRVFLSLGIGLGFDGGLDRLHGFVFKMIADLDNLGQFSYATLDAIESEVGWDSNPIYALLHEPCWCFGPGVKPDWAAERVGRDLTGFKWLRRDWDMSVDADEPLYFLGEMVPSFLFDAYSELRKMKETAQKLAEFDGWTPLYDPEQLAKNKVPVYAACYNDMYVDASMARVTASRIKGIKVFETNVLFHSALRSHSEDVFRELFKLRDDTIN